MELNELTTKVETTEYQCWLCGTAHKNLADGRTEFAKHFDLPRESGDDRRKKSGAVASGPLIMSAKTVRKPRKAKTPQPEPSFNDPSPTGPTQADGVNEVAAILTQAFDTNQEVPTPAPEPPVRVKQPRQRKPKTSDPDMCQCGHPKADHPKDIIGCKNCNCAGFETVVQ